MVAYQYQNQEFGNLPCTATDVAEQDYVYIGKVLTKEEVAQKAEKYGGNCKMKIEIVAMMLLCVLLVGCGASVETHPFQNLKVEDVTKVELQVTPPDKSMTLTGKDLEECIKALQEIELVEKVSSETLVGRGVNCSITKKDGSTIKLTHFDSYTVIDDVWYTAKGDGDDALCTLADRLMPMGE